MVGGDNELRRVIVPAHFIMVGSVFHSVRIYHTNRSRARGIHDYPDPSRRGLDSCGPFGMVVVHDGWR